MMKKQSLPKFIQALISSGTLYFVGEFEFLEAQVSAAKAAYLSALILKAKSEVKKFSTAIPLADYMITHPDYNFLNKRLKFTAKGEALFIGFKRLS
ncbi:MAG: hypothetical protein J0G96_01865 [Flavobacteriia bacterium]|nr:hypothetical protein [Flavobacteriia bacterium]OJX39729.1 MAG: hypothetical protein BGO87_01880 [Flavobacteriia bacterium 40-80]